MLTLLSFLGGSAFRLIFGGVMDWLNKRQDHLHEMELQRLQSELEASRHARDLERIRLQSDLKINEVKVMGIYRAHLSQRLVGLNKLLALMGVIAAAAMAAVWAGIVSKVGGH